MFFKRFANIGIVKKPCRYFFIRLCSLITGQFYAADVNHVYNSLKKCHVFGYLCFIALALSCMDLTARQKLTEPCYRERIFIFSRDWNKGFAFISSSVKLNLQMPTAIPDVRYGLVYKFKWPRLTHDWSDGWKKILPSFYQKRHMSQRMRFPTIWHFDMCRLRWASAASF